MERSAQPVMPMGFLMHLRRKFPQFAQTAPQTGLYMQQDAEECWTQLLYTLRESLRVSLTQSLYSYPTLAALLISLHMEVGKSSLKFSSHITLHLHRLAGTDDIYLSIYLHTLHFMRQCEMYCLCTCMHS